MWGVLGLKVKGKHWPWLAEPALELPVKLLLIRGIELHTHIHENTQTWTHWLIQENTDTWTHTREYTHLTHCSGPVLWPVSWMSNWPKAGNTGSCIGEFTRSTNFNKFAWLTLTSFRFCMCSNLLNLFIYCLYVFSASKEKNHGLVQLSWCIMTFYFLLYWVRSGVNFVTSQSVPIRVSNI